MSAKHLQISLILGFLFFTLLTAYWTLQRYGYFVPKISGNVQIAGASTSSANLATPVTLVLPSAHINLPIVITHMKGKTWPTTPQGVSYLANTALPGDVGNSVFYGHNWPSLLGNLKNTRVGDNLTIYYNDQSKREFKINSVTVVGPNSTEILAPSNSPKITLYTCIGLLDQKRLVVTAI